MKPGDPAAYGLFVVVVQAASKQRRHFPRERSKRSTAVLLEKLMFVLRKSSRTCVRIIQCLAIAWLASPAVADLYVSDGKVNLFDDAGKPKPFLDSQGNPINITGNEGIACITTNGTPRLFVANNDTKIMVYDLTTGQGSVFATVNGAVGALSLSQDGALLYAGVYGAHQIVALDATQPKVTAPVYSYTFGSPDASHDVRVGPDGLVYASDFQNNTGILRFTRELIPDPTLTPPGQFISSTYADSNGLFAPAGMAFDNKGNLWVSNFHTVLCPAGPITTNCSAIDEFSPTGTFIQNIPFPANGAPFGLALGPDNNIYVAEFLNQIVAKVIPGLTTSCTTPGSCDFITNLGMPKYLSFTEIDCKSQGYIEVCKISSDTNPVPNSGIYSFTATGSSFTSDNPLLVPVGECSGPVLVSAPAASIKELPLSGTAVSAITATGYSAPPVSMEENRLDAVNFQAGTATITVLPPVSSGDKSTETIVTFTNYQAGPAQLKVCKIAGTNVKVGTPFNFTVTPSTGTIPAVEAGPAAEGGFCIRVPGTYPVGSSVTVTETLPSPNPYADPAVTVNGVATAPTKCNGSPCVVAVIGSGVNEVTFTNSTCAQAPACPPASAVDLPGLDMAHYSLMSQRTVSDQVFLTFSASLVNRSDTRFGSVVATLKRPDNSNFRVIGEGTLEFDEAPANAEVATWNTFTIVIEAGRTFDVSMMEWEFHSRRGLPLRK